MVKFCSIFCSIEALEYLAFTFTLPTFTFTLGASSFPEYRVVPFCVTVNSVSDIFEPFGDMLYRTTGTKVVSTGFFSTFLTTFLIALFKADAFLAEKYSPPVAFAIQANCLSVFLSTLKPIT